MQDKPKLLDQVREKLRVKLYSIRTEQAYVDWIKRFVLFHRKRHPETMGNREVSEFISHLATHRNVAAPTQNQALSALVFLYQQVLGRDLGWLDELERAKRPARLPVVLTQAEVRSLLAHLDGRQELMAKLLYGAGLRLMECVRLRVKDADFERGEILVRDGKGGKDRVTLLAQSATEPLKNHLEKVRAIHENDLTAGFGEVYLPFALERKYQNAAREWGWQYVFPASKRSVDPRPGKGGEKRRARLSNSETGDLPHLAPFLCDPSTGVRL